MEACRGELRPRAETHRVRGLKLVSDSVMNFFLFFKICPLLINKIRKQSKIMRFPKNSFPFGAYIPLQLNHPEDFGGSSFQFHSTETFTGCRSPGELPAPSNQ